MIVEREFHTEDAAISYAREAASDTGKDHHVYSVMLDTDWIVFVVLSENVQPSAPKSATVYPIGTLCADGEEIWNR